MRYPIQFDCKRKELIRILSLYRRLELRQLLRFFPDIEEASMISLLKRLHKQGRLSVQIPTISYLPQKEPPDGIPAAIDLLLDFYPEVTYHSLGEYPVTLTFFARNEGYDVIWIPEGKETLIAHALALQPHRDSGNQRLVILTNLIQLQKVAMLPDITAYCIVSNGNIQYYKTQRRN